MARKTASEQKKKKKLKKSSKQPLSIQKKKSTSDPRASHEDCAGRHLNEKGECQCFLKRGAMFLPPSLVDNYDPSNSGNKKA